MERSLPLKRRACEPCRKLKVHCSFDSEEAASCTRCLKAGKECIVTGRRRRAPLTQNQITELEKTLNALTASLDAIKSKSSSVVSNPSQQSGDDDNGTRKVCLSRDAEAATFEGTEHGRHHSSFGAQAGAAAASENTPNLNRRSLAHPDELFDKGILTPATAAAPFGYFRGSMLQHFPCCCSPWTWMWRNFNEPVLSSSWLLSMLHQELFQSKSSKLLTIICFGSSRNVFS